MPLEQFEGVDLEFGVCSPLGQRFHFPRIPPTQPHSKLQPFPFLPSPSPLSTPPPLRGGSRADLT